MTSRLRQIAAIHFGFRVQLFFVVAMAGADFLSYQLASRPEPDAEPGEPLMVVNAFLRPTRAVAYLINLVEPLPRLAPQAPPPRNPPPPAGDEGSPKR